ncbi:hypothetical protein mvi_33060 [Methylobacterium indicum]|uniref:Uncharacterized protein n=1 Tax=Methylobacterium indicum TaxID=1775910 RepID=A0A8H9C7Z5_9HYPH|nr:hypothetical protein mvi_33060 [Methylobacterium indicum]
MWNRRSFSKISTPSNRAAAIASSFSISVPLNDTVAIAFLIAFSRPLLRPSMANGAGSVEPGAAARRPPFVPA